MTLRTNFNPQAMEISISNLAQKAVRGASEVMRRHTIKIRDLARMYAPRDTGTLENAIEYETIKSTNGGRNLRNVFVVYVDLDRINPKDGKEVRKYVKFMENDLIPYNIFGRGHLNLRDNSNMKTMMGNKVGARFMARASIDGGKTLSKEVLNEVTRIINGSLITQAGFDSDFGEM